ncbi:hypothetical protein Dsin_010908 [Dipteronia sinensis]|uniref:Wax synthase domain-containing protein n=1 Tax=Dipteronia sinensis TaxID=43782 RepID=A0AAE0ED09_9ROSI|nr:hypothetical protein Dsin_010908 [Dipteronia sinensis]
MLVATCKWGGNCGIRHHRLDLQVTILDRLLCDCVRRQNSTKVSYHSRASNHFADELAKRGRNRFGSMKLCFFVSLGFWVPLCFFFLWLDLAWPYVGPLSSNPSISLAVFLAVASLPIKLQQNLPPNGQNKKHPSLKKPKNGSPMLVYAIKGLVLAIVVYTDTNYWEHIHPKMLLFSTCVHFYLLTEMTLVLISTLTGALLGLELEPTFNEPYLSTSLQNFWGQRWNHVTSNILRLSVHQPTKKMFTRILGSRWATPSAIVATFFLSGVVHDLMFYHLVRVKPTGEMTCFFLLHGMWIVVEIELKKTFNKLDFPWLISVFLTLGFLFVTSSWLLFAPLKRCKAYARALDEYVALAALFHVGL